MGAGLCAMAARLSARQLSADETAHLTTESERLARAAASLIQADADSYQGVLAARRQPRGPDPEARRRQIEAALSDAASAPMQIVELAVPVARIAARLAAACNPNLRGDAITGALLAEAGAPDDAGLGTRRRPVVPGGGAGPRGQGGGQPPRAAPKVPIGAGAAEVAAEPQAPASQ